MRVAENEDLHTQVREITAFARGCRAAGSTVVDMSRILLIYATREGQTGKVAARIAKHLENLGHEVALVNAYDREFIAGALTYSKYSWPLKWLMKRIAKQAGEGTDVSQDYEYTDWEQVERYAMRLVHTSVRSQP